MYGKIVLVLAFAAVAMAVEYPAGVNPAVCPNYPYCDPALMARFTPDGMPIPEWGLPANYIPVPAPAAVPRYPAGLPPALCPNYPYCW